MMNSKVLVISMVLLASLAASEGFRSLGVEQHCRCIHTESKPIGRHIAKVEIIPPNSHCEATEILATLKNTGLEVCLDPEAPWVKKMIARIVSNNKRR